MRDLEFEWKLSIQTRSLRLRLFRHTVRHGERRGDVLPEGIDDSTRNYQPNPTNERTNAASQLLCALAASQTKQQTCLPIRYNPQRDQVDHVVMSHRTPSTEIFLQPIKDGLRERHHDGSEAYNGGCWPLCDVGEIDVVEVHESFDEIEEGLGVCEAIAFFEGLDAVDLCERLSWD